MVERPEQEHRIDVPAGAATDVGDDARGVGRWRRTISFVRANSRAPTRVEPVVLETELVVRVKGRSLRSIHAHSLTPRRSCVGKRAIRDRERGAGDLLSEGTPTRSADRSTNDVARRGCVARLSGCVEELDTEADVDPEIIEGARPVTTANGAASDAAEPSEVADGGWSTLLIFTAADLVWLGLLVGHGLDRTRAVDAEPPYVVAAFAVVWAVGMIVRSRRAVPRLHQLPIRGTRSMWSHTLGHLLATLLATIWLILGLASCAVVLATHGLAITADPAPTDLRVGDVHQHLAWEVIDALPVLDLPDTLGWERPIEDPSAPLGVLAVVARGVFLLVVVRLVVALVRLSRPDSEQTAGRSGSSSPLVPRRASLGHGTDV